MVHPVWNIIVVISIIIIGRIFAVKLKIFKPMLCYSIFGMAYRNLNTNDKPIIMFGNVSNEFNNQICDQLLQISQEDHTFSNGTA